MPIASQLHISSQKCQYCPISFSSEGNKVLTILEYTKFIAKVEMCVPDKCVQPNIKKFGSVQATRGLTE
jgi:hypothetical protein